MNAPSTLTESADSKNSPMHRLSKPVPYTAPGHLRAAAYLYGVETPPLEKARVLELGCETGGNLLPFALAYPSAAVVGVDLWSENVQDAREIARELGVENLTYHNKPYTEIDRNFGEFDYIIVHDQFTLAPSASREAILRICRENLAPLGVAYISYNTYPGWKAGDILRDAMQLHNHSAISLEEVISGAAAMLHPMSDGVANSNLQAASLKLAVDKITKHPDYYISKEFLQCNTASFYFIEFAEAAAQAGLTYVGDAEPQEEISATYGPNVQLNQSLITLGQPKMMKQQYLDFAVGREFRRSLLVHQERAHQVLNTPDQTRFTELNWAAGLTQKKVTTAPGNPATFSNGLGAVFSITDETAIRVCEVLSSVWPMSLTHDHLVTIVQDVEAWLRPDKYSDALESVQRALVALFKIGVLEYRIEPGPYNGLQSNALQLLTSARVVPAESPEDSIVHGFNLWHMSTALSLNPSQVRLIEKIDGTRSASQLLTCARQMDEIESTASDVPDSENQPYAKKSLLVTELPSLIDVLRMQGTLTGSAAAWLDYFTAMLRTEHVSSVSRLKYLPPFLQHLRRVGQQSDKIPSFNGSRHTRSRDIGVSVVQRPEVQKTFKRVQALRSQQKFSEAEPIARELIAANQDNAVGWHLLGIILGEMGEPAQSVSPFLNALSLQPANMAVYADLSATLQILKERRHAEAILRYALDTESRYIPNWLNLGNLLRDLDNPALAEICCRKALEIEKNNPSALNNLSTVVGDQGRLKESIDCLRKVISAQPNNYMVHSNLLFMLSQYADISPAALFEEHCAYGRKVDAASKKHGLNFNHKNRPDPSRALRVGFVSGDLCNHAVANFLEPIWRSLDKQSFEIFAYNNTPIEDAVSMRLAAQVKSWKKVRQLTDSDLAKLIHKDEIDILFDLSGHTAHNRLPMFSLKPAPIQVSWIGYPGTTGLKAMDYRIANKHVGPLGFLDKQFVEKLIYMPSITPFSPYPNSPEVNILPALSTESFTFGNFNRVSKLSEQTISIWSRILKALPNSRLLMGHINGSSMAAQVEKSFACHGVDGERLILCDRRPMPEYLALHHRVDVLLDTFPYTGGTTTHHGLWMGVPTITLAGQTTPSRAGASIMNQFNLNGFIAETETEYINCAIKWAGHTLELAKLRSTMRARLQESPAYSHEYVAKCLEATLRRIWQGWCQDAAVDTVVIEF